MTGQLRPSKESYQCYQIGLFLKAVAIKLFCKVGQTIVWAKLKNFSFKEITMATFWSTFGCKWATFFINIWSH